MDKVYEKMAKEQEKAQKAQQEQIKQAEARQRSAQYEDRDLAEKSDQKTWYGKLWDKLKKGIGAAADGISKPAADAIRFCAGIVQVMGLTVAWAWKKLFGKTQNEPYYKTVGGGGGRSRANSQEANSSKGKNKGNTFEKGKFALEPTYDKFGKDKKSGNGMFDLGAINNKDTAKAMIDTSGINKENKKGIFNWLCIPHKRQTKVILKDGENGPQDQLQQPLQPLPQINVFDTLKDFTRVNREDIQKNYENMQKDEPKAPAVQKNNGLDKQINMPNMSNSK